MRMFRWIFFGLAPVGIFSCHARHTLFEKISSSHSGITFTNRIVETDSINPMNVVNIYNGGGVGIGDFNNDGLPDIFFTGNQVYSKLYLNKGRFQFEDITDRAGVEGLGRWARGVSVVDVNNDGLMDIYICNTIYKDSFKRRNILYVNQGLDKNGIPHFKDMAAEYGLDIHVQSTMASFFDYDNDGDLDMYLTVNEAKYGYSFNVFGKRGRQDSGFNRGRLYRNDWDTVLGHPVYHDVSDAAGIIYEGFGHAATICDINGDGWKDIYVSNDFIPSNILYINNHDGTFTNRLKDYFKHTSLNSMGQDVVDMNNDGLPDVIELDMAPHDNYRKKTMATSDNYFSFQQFDHFGYEYQYVRNTLQLNQGPRVGENDSLGAPAFCEIGFLSGISQTDWSWAPLIADLDNDGYRDLIVTNGFPRDVSDLDFIAYRDMNKGKASQKDLLDRIPQVKLSNYGYRNNGNLSFSDESVQWGLEEPSFSNGAAYADLDNDGAIDMVVSNINDEAFLYRNTSRDMDRTAAHYLQLKYKGPKNNVNGVGAVARIYYDHGRQQVYDNNPYRGYLSSMQGITHFGLGKTLLIDSVVIQWYNGLQQIMTNVKADQVLTVNIKDARQPYGREQPAIASDALFGEVTRAAGVTYRDSSHDFVDFNIQPLLPHKLSEYSPALAAGDVDGDGYDDLVVSGSGDGPAHILLQQASGRFVERGLLPGLPGASDHALLPGTKDEGLLLFDANGDGAPDLYIVSGGIALPAGDKGYQDRLYINDGNGNFTLDTTALPLNTTSKLCVRAVDYNRDGKLDLFVSGRVDPWNYPRPVSSRILRNDSHDGHVKFTDVTEEVAPELLHIGMVCDALFSDFDGDGQVDLIVAGEWMPVTFFKNEGGKFRNVTMETGVGGRTGWWNSIVAGDFRHTGRMDYIVGNLGSNSLYQASEDEPVGMTARDFSGNGKYIGIPSLFLPDRDGVRREFPAPGRDEITRVLPGIKKKFPTYKPFAQATLDEVLTQEQREGALRLKANMLRSCYLRNDGGGKFTLIPLPVEAQFSVINGMVVDDFDGDGNLDVLINGNDFGTAVGIGRYDALNGLLLKGDGVGRFVPLSIVRSGIYIPGNGKALVKLRGATGLRGSSDDLVAASQNRDVLKLYRRKVRSHQIPVKPDDVSAVIRYKDGKVRKEEFYYGSSFLSQSARFLDLSAGVVSVVITDYKGKSREVALH
ncbi:MAG: RNA-binding protein [Sphingobacteriales bacterium 50-39]|nr:VCBS repeat-containing protein [Sphingobacteriales bacterium]OJW54209.1 MAG: RNA-binding protein [Sphingobacteriales bacterium 50-39]